MPSKVWPDRVRSVLAALPELARGEAQAFDLSQLLESIVSYANDTRKEGQADVTFEVAMLGRSGFDINSPDKKYTLKSLPGHFSGLHLVSMMYVAMKSMVPTTDVGIDLSKEYAEAKRLFALEK
jgi:hypothetical protein